MKLLIVDDERSTREGLLETVDWHSVRVRRTIAVRNAFEAIREMKAEPADILLTDIRMPGMDGLELASYVLQRWPAVRVILLSAYADFAYARTALTLGVHSYLLKPVDIPQLLQCVQTQVEEMERYRRARHDIPCEEDSLWKWLTEGEPIPPFLQAFPSVCAIILQQKRSSRPPKEAKETDESLGPMLVSALPKSYTLYKLPSEHPGQWQYLMPVQSNADVDAAFENLAMAFSSIANRVAIRGTTISGAISELFPREQAAQAFTNARHTLDFSFFLGNGSLLSATMLKSHTCEPIEPLFASLSKLQDALNKLDTTTCLSVLHTILTQYRFSAPLDIPVIEDNCHAILALLAERFDSPNIANILGMKDGIQTIHHDTLDAWIAYLETAYSAILELATQGGSPRGHFMVNALKEYLQQHYLDADISVTTAAAYLDRNPNYLSHLFFQKEKVSFTEYLNQLRIHHAMKLLRETTLASYEVAAQSGFSNYRYFTQVFKKIAGDSPTQWRNSNT